MENIGATTPNAAFRDGSIHDIIDGFETIDRWNAGEEFCRKTLAVEQQLAVINNFLLPYSLGPFNDPIDRRHRQTQLVGHPFCDAQAVVDVV